MLIKALELSKYIISKCINDKDPITNLQLQKILYYIQYDFLSNRNEPIFSDDIEAWAFGPVIPNVYYYFSVFGSDFIDAKFENYQEIIDNESIRNIIDSIVEKKRKLNPWDMVEDTHKKGKAWDLIYNDKRKIKKIIPIDLIKKGI